MTKTKQAHTPTPWQFGNCIVKGKKWIEISKQNSASFALFISPYINNFNSEEIQANAAFIVRAVNSHEELLEALKEVVRYMKNETDNPSAVYDRVKQAIANAENE